MDLGIAGKKALVCASSKGLGKGCALTLAEAGVDLVLNARGSKALNETAEAIRSRFNVRVEAVVADITTPEGQEEVLTRAGAVDILVNNAGGPPPGMWSDWGRDDFMAALNANMLTPITLMSRLLPTMIEKGWGRVVNYLPIRQSADCGSWLVKFSTRWIDRLCRRNSGRRPLGNGQQSFAGRSRYRRIMSIDTRVPIARDPAGTGGERTLCVYLRGVTHH